MSANTIIEHIVLFSVSQPDCLEDAVTYVKSLQTKAVKDGKPYILSISCGTTRPSQPVRTLGYNLSTYMRFASDEDRLYFVEQDPAHQELIKFFDGKLAKEVFVLDFVDGLADVKLKPEFC